MVNAVTYAFLALMCGVAVLGVLIVVVRGLRLNRSRRNARLAAAPRRALLAFVADGGAEGGDELVAIPAAAWRAAEPTAISLLSKIRGEAHQALVTVFERRGAADSALRALHGRGRIRRARAAEALGNLGRRDAVPGLCALLDDPRGEVRVVAVRALGRIGDPAAAEPLLATLAGPDPAPSQLVAHALIQLGLDAQPALTASLRHPAPLVRVTALDALGLLGAAGSAGPVADVLRGDDWPGVRVAAATTLGRLGIRSAVGPLTEAARPDQPIPLRVAAAKALGEVGGAGVVPPLATLLADPEYRVAHEAAHALRRLGPSGLAELRRIAADAPGAGAPDAGVSGARGPDAGAREAGASGAGAPGGGAVAHAREALAMAAVGLAAVG